MLLAKHQNPVRPGAHKRPLKTGAGEGNGNGHGDADAAAPAEMNVTAIEAEVMALFVQLARVLGLPRSYAEIYGMLFISAQPLSMEQLIERMRLSRGSASQGLRFLRNLGAIKMVYIPGERSIHYEAVAQLRHLVTRFLSDHVVPQLDIGLERLEQLARMAQELPPEQRSHVKARVGMLRSWEKKSRRYVKIVAKLLGSA